MFVSKSDDRRLVSFCIIYRGIHIQTDSNDTLACFSVSGKILQNCLYGLLVLVSL